MFFSLPGFFSSRIPQSLGFLVLTALASSAVAKEASEMSSPSLPKGIDIEGFDTLITESHVFTNAHPDLRYRKRGQDELRRNRFDKAIFEFERAALHADKISQSILAEMYWHGRGVAVDRPLAYVWADLAAERMTPSLLAKREHYWQALSETERQKALAIGIEYYARYGDEIAQPRQEKGMKRSMQFSLNRRFVRDGKVCLNATIVDTSGGASLAPNAPPSKPSPIICLAEISGDKFYNPKYWQPKQYWAWQEKVMEASFNPHIFPLPEVDVGPIDTNVR